jgi:hypothetical protein
VKQALRQQITRVLIEVQSHMKGLTNENAASSHAALKSQLGLLHCLLHALAQTTQKLH